MPRKTHTIDKGQVTLTTFFTPGSQAKPSSSKKTTITPRQTVAAGGSTKKKGKRRENNSSGLSTPGTLKGKTRRTSALASDANLGIANETFAHCEGSHRHVEVYESDSDGVIDLTGSPVAQRTVRYGLPTPVTAVKSGAPPRAEATPTPTHRPGQRLHNLVSTPRAELALATPPNTRSPKRILQQPTPSTPPRLVRMHALPQSLFSPPSPRKQSPRGRPPYDDASGTRFGTTLSESQEIVPSSQTQEDNPFDVRDKGGSSKNLGSLFKLPLLPARFEASCSLPCKSPTRVASLGRTFTMPTSPASAPRRRSSGSSSDSEIVPTSQVNEEELIFFSPGRSSSKSLSLVKRLLVSY